MPTLRVLTHGGAGSPNEYSDGTDEAADTALEALESQATPLEAVCQAVAELEDDERFNAGTGSNLRADDQSVQMDAACATPDNFGAVACIERVRNPVLVARAVLDTDELILAGRGAEDLARENGHEAYDVPARPKARDGDTVGAIAHDGETYAAALSSGGTRNARVGRVGDVPIPGAGLRVGQAGAVAATGHGETIVEQRVADRAYERIANGETAQQAVDAALDTVDEDILLGLIAMGSQSAAGGASREMAYSQQGI